MLFKILSYKTLTLCLVDNRIPKRSSLFSCRTSQLVWAKSSLESMNAALHVLLCTRLRTVAAFLYIIYQRESKLYIPCAGVMGYTRDPCQFNSRLLKVYSIVGNFYLDHPEIWKRFMIPGRITHFDLCSFICNLQVRWEITLQYTAELHTIAILLKNTKIQYGFFKNMPVRSFIKWCMKNVSMTLGNKTL